MRLKLRATANITLWRNNTSCLHFAPGDVAYALVHDDGSWFLSDASNEIYYGAFRVCDLNGRFISDFDKEEYEKHFRQIQYVKMFDYDGNLVAEAESGVVNFI